MLRQKMGIAMPSSTAVSLASSLEKIGPAMATWTPRKRYNLILTVRGKIQRHRGRDCTSLLLLADLARHEGARLYTLKDEGRRLNAKSSVSPYGPSLGRQAFGAGRRAGRRETRAPSNATQAQGYTQINYQPCLFRRRRSVFFLLRLADCQQRLHLFLLCNTKQQRLLSDFVSRLAQYLLVNRSDRHAIDPQSCSLSGRRSICQSKSASTVSDTSSTPYRNLFLGLP
jgi:hypothetical protein